MRVILSRKGFDSGYGKVPSPILPDGRMISLPIPDRDAPVSYGEIKRDGICLGEIVADLTKNKIPPNFRAHLDPDLDPHAVIRPNGWSPIFGQSGAALRHLQKEGVCTGDLFLFFGWFQPVERVNGIWRYLRGSRCVHALWGWMRVGEIHKCCSLPSNILRWAADHPHLNAHKATPNNVIIAADDLVIASRRLPGSGIFSSRSERILTNNGESRSVWRLPAWMHPDAGLATLSYHKDINRWSAINAENCRLKSVPKGQEFVLKVNKSEILTQWLENLFADISEKGGNL